MTPMTRRRFLQTTGASSAALSLGLVPSSTTRPLERRPLGTTGLEVTILGLGSATFGGPGHSLEEGAAIVEACLDAGINYIDCASTYGNAEEKVGEVMRGRRAEAILATKTLERDRERAWREVNRSLERLSTGFVDILQIHAVNRWDDLELVTARNGCLAAALRAQDEGMCRHIGISGHSRVEVLVEALRRFPFSTVLVPLSSMDALVHDFGPEIFRLSAEHRFGVLAMKVLAAGRMVRHVPESLRYTLSLPVASAVVGMGTPREVRQNVAAAEDFQPMTETEQREFENDTRPSATTSVLWWKRR